MGEELKHLVFVYGTLKSTEPNFTWMTETTDKDGKDVGKAVAAGTGRTEQKYPLVIASRYNIPFLLDVPGRGNQIQGELYRVNDKKLAHLDILEDYPKLYTRRNESIVTDNGEVIQAITYFLLKHKPAMLALDMYPVYNSKGTHGKEYFAEYTSRDPDEIDVSQVHDELMELIGS